MVQESRSLLIQQLFHGGFKEDDDDDEDEDESHELVKRHPSSDERQGFGRKEHTHQELIQGVLEGGRLNKGLDTSTKQNFGSRPKLLASPKLWKHPEAELQSANGDYLQPEKDIIEEGSKKLLQIHSEFLIRQQNPARRAQQEPETTPKDSSYFSKNSHKQQQQVHGGEGLVSPGLVFSPPKLVSKNKEEKDQMVLVADAQQSYGSVEDALLSTQRDFTSPVSPEEEDRKQRCFAVLNNEKVAARELNAAISIPVFSTGIEKKSSISGCTESLASDRGSSTDSVNGGDEVIQDVTSVEKTLNFGDQFSVLQSSADERPSAMETTATVRIARVEEVVQQVESVVPALQLETAESWKNRKSETTERTKEWRNETSAEYKQAFEENHVEFFSKVHERVEFKSSVLEHSTAKVFGKISVKRDSSNIAAGEQSPLEPASLILAGRAEKIGDAGSFKLGKDIVGATGGAKVFVNEISLVEKELQQQDVLSASHNLSSNEEEIRQSESPRKHCAGAASLRTCLREVVSRGDDPVVAADTNKGELHMTADTKPLEKVVVASENDDIFMIYSPIGSPKEQLADTAHHDVVYLLDEEDERVTLASPEGKCLSPVCQATETSLTEMPVLVSSLVQKASTNRRSLSVERSEVHTTPAVTSPQMVQTPGSPIVESLPTSPPAAVAVAVNKRRKSNRKTGSSKKSKTKKTARVQHQDARTMVFVRSDTRVAYNNGPHFATNADHSEVSQHNAMANVMNPCLYDFAGSSQPVQAAAFMSHETDVHLLQAQTSAKDAMVAATSALAQSHCEWSRMRAQATQSRLTVMQESQIAAIAASVAAAAMVAKAAVEAARAIQEASKDFLGQLGGPSQLNFGKSGFARSAEVLARDHDKILEMPNCQPVQLSNPSTINPAVRQIKNQRPGSSSGESNDDVVEAKPRERSVRFMKQEVVSEDQKVAGEGVCKKRTRHEMEQTQRVSAHASSHAELRDPGGETFRCTQGASNGHELDELVEVMTEEVGIQGGWFVAKVLMKTDTEAFVQYNELFRDDGCTPRSNLFPLSSFRDEGTCRRTQHTGDRRWLRPLHPVNKTRKLCCSSTLPQSWTVGNHVDAYSNGGWWEGFFVEIDRADETNVKIQFPGGKGIQTMKARDVRPSLVWAEDDWRPWKENSTSQDEPSSKRVKLEAAADNGKTKREETSRKEKTQSLKKLVQESTSGTPVSEALATPRVSRRSAEAATRKTANTPHAKLNNNRSLNVSRTVRFPATKLVRHKTHRHEQQAPTNPSSRSARVEHSTTSKKAPSLTPFSSARKGAVSTRLQLKTEAAKCKQLTNMALSSVIQKGAKSVSTRRDVMKLKSKDVPTKLLKALKNTSKLKFPRRSHKNY